MTDRTTFQTKGKEADEKPHDFAHDRRHSVSVDEDLERGAESGSQVLEMLQQLHELQTAPCNKHSHVQMLYTPSGY